MAFAQTEKDARYNRARSRRRQEAAAAVTREIRVTAADSEMLLSRAFRRTQRHQLFLVDRGKGVALKP